MESIIIQTENIKRYYQQGNFEIKALDGVSLNFNSAEFTAIIGPSGSGKTTLLNCIGALDKPTEGRIIFEKKDLSELPSKEMANFRLHRLGFVFQAYNLIPVFTAFENVAYVLILQKIAKEERLARVNKLFTEMGMSELAERFPREMSGGQQQRVAVARALISEPRVVLADEPTANLDSENADKLLTLMREMSEKKDTTFLFSTHDSRVMKEAKRIISLRDGKVDKDETT